MLIGPAQLCLNVLDLGLIGVDAEHRVLFVNRAAESLYGCKATEARGELLTNLIKLPQDHLWSKIWRKLTKQGSWQGEVLQQTGKGHPVLVDWTLKQVSSGNSLSVLSIARVLERSPAVKRPPTAVRSAERQLQRCQEQLAQQHEKLQRKNIALQEVLLLLRDEAERINAQVQANITQLVLPTLARLRSDAPKLNPMLLDVLESNLQHLTSAFGNEITHDSYKLTSRELMVCNMIRSGLSSKEIASLLNIHFRSVETHRRSIRRKLGLTNKRVSLSAHLKNLAK